SLWTWSCVWAAWAPAPSGDDLPGAGMPTRTARRALSLPGGVGAGVAGVPTGVWVPAMSVFPPRKEVVCTPSWTSRGVYPHGPDGGGKPRRSSGPRLRGVALHRRDRRHHVLERRQPL